MDSLIGAPIERLDVETVVKASQALSGEMRSPELIRKLVRLAVEHAGAARGLIVLQRGDELKVQAVATAGRAGIEVAVRAREVTPADLPLSILGDVVRTRKSVILGDATAAAAYSNDEYLRRTGVRSVLCLPILNQANLLGVLYVENDMAPHAFTSDRVAVLEMLASQAAISLENARLYLELQRENHDRRRVEEALLRSEAYLHEAQGLGGMGSFVLDPVSELMQASPELLRILGRDPDVADASLDLLRECIHPDDRQMIEELRSRAIEQKAPWRFSYRILLPNNTIIFAQSVAEPVIENGELIEYVGTLIDVTQHKLAELQLRLSQALLSEAQRLSRTGSYVLSNPDGTLAWTAEMYRIFEYDPNDGLTKDKVIARMHPDDQDRMRAGIDAALDGRPEGYNLDPAEYRLLMPDGRIKFISSVRAPAGPEFSDVVRVIGATMDVTERKHAEEALLRAQADLAHVSRVNTMGELTAALAHEVNQPITAAVTNANAALRFLSGDKPDVEEAREAVTAIVHAGGRVADIISRTRAFFRKGVPQRGPVDVDDLVRDTIVLLESEARRYSVSIRTWLAAGFPAAVGDRVQLQQVIVNLVMNGIDAMKDIDGVRELAIRTGGAGEGEIVVSISDTGVGLPPADVDRIFNTFFTTKPEGTGMGLSISRSIVEAHGGRLWAASNAPRGTIFRFALPVSGRPED